jgi:hypothetical protein
MMGIHAAAAFVFLALAPQRPPDVAPDVAQAARLEAALGARQLSWRFSEPKEVARLIGRPRREETRPDGGMEILTWHYGSGLAVRFVRMQNEHGAPLPFGLVGYEGKNVPRAGRPQGQPLRPRSISDLKKMDTVFEGLMGMDLTALDLTKEEKLLRSMPFDTFTKWPGAEKLPKAFDPQEIMESGKNPGLGMRALHARGMDGRGVGVAVIDQPLLPDHAEIEGRIKTIAELGVEGFGPQMHGPAVASLAIGGTCGAAPGASLYYASVAMWADESVGNRHYIQALESVLDLNKNSGANIRVVSISTGMFGKNAHFDEWRALLERAEATGVLVITCDLEATGLRYGLLRPLGDRDGPGGYTAGTYARKGDLLVPGDGRAYAGRLGRDAYVYGPVGGMSWAAPWIAGLAALGFQANPGLSPAEIRKYLIESATNMPYGSVANPERFLEMCAAGRAGRGDMPEAPGRAAGSETGGDATLWGPCRLCPWLGGSSTLAKRGGRRMPAPGAAKQKSVGWENGGDA